MELSTAIEGCRKGSRAAQHCLFSRYAEQMFILCYRYVKNREDAEELMLNGFLSFFKSIARFQYNGEGSVAPWLRKIDQTPFASCASFLHQTKSLTRPDM
jgi:RNA polymerase sigma-70 factor (ECF subfamily)